MQERECTSPVPVSILNNSLELYIMADLTYMDVENYRLALPEEGRLLGIDLGTKTIGLALSDTRRMVATPMETLSKGKFSKDLLSLQKIVEAQDICGFVMGLPLHMDGSESPRSQSSRAFARNLKGQIELPVLLWDERMSSQAVTRTLLEADTSRAKRAEVIDKMAASFILQGALDRMMQP